jgi:hypothetical protein
MNSDHWTDDELLEHLYGVSSPHDGHLSACPECAARADHLARVRAQVTRAPEISEEFLAAQRRGIYQRLGSPLPWHPMRWALPMAATLAFALGLTLYRANQPLHSRDDQFYAEISSLDQNPAPRAVQPIEALVQDDIQE